MTAPFDPYHKWLGIPPQEQPPNHYRLLGIAVFESDADVIANAADGRMVQLKSYQSGKHSAHSQRLLNEIATAKVCLLSAAKKAEYDSQLRKQSSAKAAAATPAIPTAVPVGDSSEIHMPEFARVHASSYLPRARRKGSRWTAPLALTGVAVLFIVFLAFWTRQNGDEAGKERAGTARANPEKPAPHNPAPPVKPTEPVSKPVEPAPPKTAPPAEPPAKEPAPGVESLKPKEPAPVPVEPQAENPVAPGSEQPVTPGETPAPPSGSPSGPKKPDVPGAAEQQEAEKRVREIFSKEFASAKTSDQKLALAGKLLDQAQATRDDAVARFVLLRLACELGASAGALTEAFGVVDKIQADFDVAAIVMKVDILAKAVEAGRAGGHGGVNPQVAIEAALGLMDEAMKTDDFKTASHICKLAATAARSTKDPQVVRDVVARTREVDRLKGKFVAVAKAMETLEADPADADANLTVGKWHCFSKGDWGKGLPLLRKGADEKLTAIADRDLGLPTDPKAQAALADAWWELAESEQGQSKSIVQGRAAHWYEQALPNLSGLDKAKVEKRLEAAASAVELPETPRPSRVRGVVQEGNVALASNGTIMAGISDGANFLLDGNSTKYTGTSGCAFSKWPCEWTITFPKVYRLQAISFLLYDLDSRFFRYRVQISADGKKFTDLVDRSQGQWRGWQRLVFPATPVKAVKLIGLYDSVNPYFYVVEFEAYCIPLSSSPKQASPSR